jgi:hypothetical protein
MADTETELKTESFNEKSKNATDLNDEQRWYFDGFHCDRRLSL